MMQRCACGYQTATAYGIRQHWADKVCPYGTGEPDKIALADIGLEPEARQLEPDFRMVDYWRFDMGSETFGDFDDLDMALEAMAEAIKKVALPLLAATPLQREAMQKVPMVRLYIFPVRDNNPIPYVDDHDWEADHGEE